MQRLHARDAGTLRVHFVARGPDHAAELLQGDQRRGESDVSGEPIAVDVKIQIPSRIKLYSDAMAESAKKTGVSPTR